MNRNGSANGSGDGSANGYGNGAEDGRPEPAATEGPIRPTSADALPTATTPTPWVRPIQPPVGGQDFTADIAELWTRSRLQARYAAPSRPPQGLPAKAPVVACGYRRHHTSGLTPLRPHPPRRRGGS